LTNYLSQYVQNYAKLAEPLYRLTEKGESFQWTEAAEKSFQTLKKALSTPFVLEYPRPSSLHITKIDPDLKKNETLMILDTDASLTAAGATLSQIQNGQERVLAYYSHAFSKEQRNYCVTRRELLALKHFEVYFQLRKFAIRTDHSALRWLQTMKNPEQQLFRWLAVLQGFDFEIFHRKGTLHGAPDALSRRSCPEDCRHCTRREQKDEINDTEEIDICHINRIFLSCEDLNVARTGIFSESQWDDSGIHTAQMDDPDIRPLLKAQLQGINPNRADFSDASAGAQYLLRQWDIPCIKNRILHRRWYAPNGRTWFQIIAPHSLCPAIILAAHCPVF